MVPHHLSHSTTQISFFVIIYTPIDSDFQSECNSFIFKTNGRKLTKMLYNYLTWITFNNVTWHYMCNNNRSEKPVTRTSDNPHPWTRVGVSAGTGTGWPGIPQGYPCYSLLGLWREKRGVDLGVVCWEIWIVGWWQIGGGGADISFGVTWSMLISPGY